MGPYVLLDELGRGGMGVVHRARHEPTGAVRALKLLAGDADPESLLRFRREVETLARAGGEGIVPVHEAGVDRGRLYFAMGLMPGGSLRGRLRARGRLEWREAATLVRDLALALHRCHALGLVHRDLKPDNVLFDEEGRARLADFGAVRDLTAASLTETGTVLGTPVYMAPEQLDGTRVDARADIYSLALILDELVSGVRPHEGASSLFQLLAAKRAPKRPALAAAPGVPPALEAVVAAALSVDPAQRPANANDFAAELDRVLASAPGPRSRLRAFAVAMAVALATAGAAGLALHAPARPGPTPTPSPSPSTSTSPTVSPRPLAASPAPTTSGDSKPREIRLVEEWGTRSWKHGGSVGALAFSPDGKQALSGSSDGTAKLWEVETGRELRSLTVLEPYALTVTGVAFLDETHVLTASARALHVWDLAPGGSPSPAVLDLDAEVKKLAVSEDGARAVAACENGGEGQVLVLWDLRTPHELARLPFQGRVVRSVALSADGESVLAGFEDGSLELREVAHLERAAPLGSHHEAVTAVAFLSHGRVLTTSAGGLLRISNRDDTGRSERSLGKSIHCAAARGSKAVVGADRHLHVLDVDDLAGEIVLRLPPWYAAYAVALSPRGDRALAGWDHAIQAWDVERQTELARPGGGHRDSVGGIGASADGTTVVSASSDCTLGVRVRDRARGTWRETVLDAGVPLVSVAVSEDGTLAVSGASNGVTGWDLRSGRKEFDSPPGERPGMVFGVSLARDARRFVSIDNGKVATVRSARTGRVESKLAPSDEPWGMHGVALSPDGLRVAASGNRLLLRPDLGLPPVVVAPELEELIPVAWSASGTRFASGDVHGIVVVADGSTGKIVRRLEGHRGWVMAALLSPDGSRVTTCGDDGAIREWSVETGALLAESLELQRSGDYVLCSAPAGRRTLVVGTVRGVVATFELPPEGGK